ncbi:SRPBCC domain-containing protein [Actinomadura sp. DC4]|uniref:SRPBCC family protein n=1 Tax=Actinomadura sp. DC4 TaxID=3055069 RepID=UPI0025B2277C|nr:SRPBCC domain-containing protein [Actinomadura sp. DC4]MDN3357156.1 SRPBCC domain-containing protein [Actinomadura sp. DC4]
MELDHEFTVPVPVDQAWPVLLDVERIAPCMPGATLDSVDGDEFTGRLKVKLGAMTITYKGSARIASQDAGTHTVSIEGTGKEARGSGTASATVQAQMHDEGERTRVTVHTKLNVTGRPAQFGRNIMSEVGGKLVNRFAGNLADEITRPVEPAPEVAPEASAPAPQATQAETAAPAPAPAEAVPGGEGAPQAAEAVTEPQVAPVEAEPAVEPAPEAPRRPATARPADDEAIDLLEFAGPSIAKRLAPVVAGLAAAWMLRRLVRRRGRRSGE